MIQRREVLLSAVSALAMGSVSGIAGAQAFPARAIRFINPYQAGSNGDTAPRLVLQRAAETIGQPFVIESHQGASGMLAMRVLAGAKNDGYTIGLGTPGTLITGPLTSQDPGFDPAQIEPITLICETPLVLSVTNSLPVANVQELIAYGRANPGKLNYAYDGVGATTHLGAELLLQTAGIQAQGVSYKGGAGAYTTDFVTGRIHFALGGVAVPLGLHRAGQLRIIAVCGERRLAVLPDIPTVAEQGLPGYDASSWFGMFAPRGMPRGAFERLGRELRAAVEYKEVSERLSAGGFLPVSSSSEELTARLAREKVRWTEVAAKAGIRKE